MIDVAHNPAGAAFLRDLVEIRHPGQQFVGLLGMLSDKDPAGVVAAIGTRVDRWVCVPTTGPRGQDAEALAARVRAASMPAPAQGHPDAVLAALVQAAPVLTAQDLESGFETALAAARPGEGILAFGSFALVEGLRDLLAEGKLSARARARGVDSGRGSAVRG